MVSLCDLLYISDLGGTHQPGEKKGRSKRPGKLGHRLKRRSGVSMRNVVRLYKQLIRSMMDYTRPISRVAARSRVPKLQVLQSKYLCFANKTGKL
jgi:hypothetical protein